MIAALAFYAFAAVLIASAVMVVTSRNPVHSVLFLILAFFNAAALFLLAGAEFLAMILVIVYVGAVAVLFLFVVMMLDVDFSRLREGFQRYAPVGAVIGAVLFAELILVLGAWQFSGDAAGMRLNPVPGNASNTRALGLLIYTDYIFLFQAAAMALLVAMMGAIVLTHRPKAGTRRQDVGAQLARTSVLDMRTIPSRAGLGELGILRRELPAAVPAVGHEAHGAGAHGAGAHGAGAPAAEHARGGGHG